MQVLINLVFGVEISVIYKGEYNEIIMETENHKWLMTSTQDEQVATTAPICFNFENAHFSEYCGTKPSSSDGGDKA